MGLSPVWAGATATGEAASTEGSSGSALRTWWEGKGLTGEWGGLRTALVDHGLRLTGKYSAGFFGVVESERGARGFYDQELVFMAELNVGKLTKWSALEGLHFESIGRWRDPAASANPNNFVLANPTFNPAPWQGGFGWRLQSVAFEWNSRELFPAKDLLQVRGGWVRPSSEFIDQPLSRLFMNNAIISARGVGANIPFSTSFSTWGGSLRIKPTPWAYTKLGLYMAFPQATATSNRGLAFAGFGPDPTQNGLFTMMEAGVTPALGAAQLPGRWALGGYYYGQQKTAYSGASSYGQYGFYAQVDQMLFREKPTPAPADGDKSFKSPVSTTPPALSEQGLRVFNLFSFAPAYNNMFPFYFQSGLAYQGLLPTRDADQLYAGVAYGQYSSAYADAQRDAGKAAPSFTLVVEGGYKVQVNKFCTLSPFGQILARPNGTSSVGPAVILGSSFSVAF